MADVFGDAVLSGVGTINALGGLFAYADSTLTGTSTINAVPRLFVGGRSALTGTATLTSNAVCTFVGLSQLIGNSLIDAFARLTLPGIGGLNANGTINARGGIIFLGVSDMSGSGTLTGNTLVLPFTPPPPGRPPGLARQEATKIQKSQPVFRDALIPKVTYEQLPDNKRAQISIKVTDEYVKQNATGGSSTVFNPCTLGTFLKVDTVQIDHLYVLFPLMGLHYPDANFIDRVQQLSGSLSGEVEWVDNPRYCGHLEFSRTQTTASAATGLVDIAGSAAISVMNSMTSFTVTTTFSWAGGDGEQKIAERTSSVLTTPTWNLYVEEGYLKAAFTTTTTDTLIGEKTIYPNREYDVALTWDGTTMSLFLDGIPVGSQEHTNPGALTTSPTGLTIGNQFNLDSGFIGQIRDFRMYNIVLPLSTIRTISKHPLVLYNVN